MRGGPVVANVHCWPCHRMDRVCWGGQRRRNHHFRRPPNKEAGALHGVEYGYSHIQNEEANPDRNSHNHQIPNLDQMVWMQSMDLGDDQWFENALDMPAAFY